MPALLQKEFTLSNGRADALETVVALLRKHKNKEYFAYERGDFWHIGIGSFATLVVDSKGETAKTYLKDVEQQSDHITKSLSAVAREFVEQHAYHPGKMYGFVGFNYAAHVRGLKFKAGEWPLLTIMVPATQVTILQNCSHIKITGYDSEEIATDLATILNAIPISLTGKSLKVDMHQNASDYVANVTTALKEVDNGLYTKVILSRTIDLNEEIDMQSFLLSGRKGNTPARSFAFNHGGLQATGFSPELVMLMENGKVSTEPVAGTRARTGSAAEILRNKLELLSDTKEIVEHVLSVKAAMDELTEVCEHDTVCTEDLMSIRERGPVQHLGSSVAGHLAKGKDAWDAFDVVFPSITASGIPKTPAIDAILRLEDRPRELYSGAVLMIEGTNFLEAALVLRTVFEDQHRHWIQAGAGIIGQSFPGRELTETCEKLASVAPFLVGKAPETVAKVFNSTA